MLSFEEAAALEFSGGVQNCPSSGRQFGFRFEGKRKLGRVAEMLPGLGVVKSQDLLHQRRGGEKQSIKPRRTKPSTEGSFCLSTDGVTLPWFFFLIYLSHSYFWLPQCTVAISLQ